MQAPRLGNRVVRGGDPVTEPLDTMVQRLLGCEWGRSIALPADMRPCDRQATERVVLHGGEVGEGRLFQLCEQHHDLVLSETDPRKAVTRG